MDTRRQFEAISPDEAATQLWRMMFNVFDWKFRGDMDPLAGYTRFYRYPELTRALKHQAERHDGAKPLSVIFLGCSIGCDAYSLALEAFRSDLFGASKLADIEALDASALFTRIAREGAYPVEAMRQVPSHCTPYFECTDRYDAVSLWPEIREHVRVHEAQTLQTWRPAATYDITVATNVFNYIRKADEMEAVADKVFAHAGTAVCFNCAGEVPEEAVARAMARHGFTYADQDFRPRAQPFQYGAEDFAIACRAG